ncbi:MAG TPA: hypothetical protein VGG08_08305 [Solirubrobacteraceae bacterium]|jgi:hypothetical protein
MQINSKRRSASWLVVFVLTSVLGVLWLGAASAVAAGPIKTTPQIFQAEAFEGRLLEYLGSGWEGSGTIFVSIQWLRCDSAGGSYQVIEDATDKTYYTRVESRCRLDAAGRGDGQRQRRHDRADPVRTNGRHPICRYG